MYTYGLIGEKLGHSLSPDIHELILRKLGIKASYNLFEVKKDRLNDAVNGLKALNVKGVNVTIPYKVKVMPYLDEISEEAEKIGAINTIVIKDDKFLGYNTDYYGFGIMMKKFNISIKSKSFVILGSGGASKAVFQYLKDNEAKEIIIVTRNEEEARSKFHNCKVMQYNDLKGLNSSEIIINCTPVGMYPNVLDCIVEKEVLRKFNVCIDLIYNPFETVFLKEARSFGNVSINGLYMLVGQAIKAEELWNNVKFDVKIIDEIYSELLKDMYEL
ncbi:shikimate dehydrogenase [Haloimpatiens sp. FM7315]|uniref:shikimate dehydrogenase n=1 Tax=Haloimpatiens sp. FM7315 TaxID=3298609 RepID=UPI0035A3C382